MQKAFFFAIKEAKDRPNVIRYYVATMLPRSLSIKKERPKGRFGMITLITDAKHTFLSYSEREDLLLQKATTQTLLTVHTPSWGHSKNSAHNQQ